MSKNGVGYFVNVDDAENLAMMPSSDGSIEVSFGSRATEVDIETIQEHAGMTVAEFVRKVLHVRETDMVLFVDGQMVGPDAVLNPEMQASITATKTTGSKG